jgi:hypothetical protein
VRRLVRPRGITARPELEPPALTLEAWIKIPAYPSGDDPRRWIAGKNGNEWDNGHYALAIAGKNVGAYLNIGGGRENCLDAWSAGSPLQLDRWHHLAMTYDGVALVVYLDGAAVASRKIGKPRISGAGAFVIGGRPDGFATAFFRGAIDEVRLHKRAMSAAEVAARAKAPADAPPDAAVALRRAFDDEALSLKLPEWAAAGAGIQPEYRR